MGERLITIISQIEYESENNNCNLLLKSQDDQGTINTPNVNLSICGINSDEEQKIIPEKNLIPSELNQSFLSQISVVC